MVSILRTKLFIPSAPATVIARPQLLARLNQGLTGKLTLVSAPAGYGKTTLLSSWAKSADPAFAWLSLDEHDNEFARFWHYVVASLQTIQPEIGKPTSILLQTPSSQNLTEAVAALINDVIRYGSSIVLVLDDYHLISDGDIQRAMSHFIEHLPGNLHLVLATREDPPLPIPLMRGRRELHELRRDDLRFSFSETRTLFESLLPTELFSDDVEFMTQRTEGWITGLQMAALSLQGRDDVTAFIHSFSGTHQFILDYLIDEVLQRQTPEIQDFLLRTSILSRFNASLCEAITGNHRQDILLELERANLFIVPLDDEKRWYRYHHLFADLLRSRLQKNDPTSIPELRLLTSQWFEDHHLIGEAIEHALAADDIDRAARLVAGDALQLTYHGELSTLNTQLETLSQHITTPSPWLNIAKACALVSTGDLDAVFPILEDTKEIAQNIPEQAEFSRLQGHIASVYAYATRLKGDFLSAQEYTNAALKYLPDEASALRGYILTLLASLHRWTGDLDLAAKTCTQAIAILKTCEAVDIVLDPWGDLAAVLITQGKLHAAFHTCQEAIAFAAQNRANSGRIPPASGYLHSCMANILREWNELEAAKKHAQEGVRLCENWGQVDFLSLAYGELARTLQACGETLNASKAAYQAKMLAKEISQLFYDRATLREAQINLLNENHQAAFDCIETVTIDIPDELRFRYVDLDLSIAKIQTAQALQMPQFDGRKSTLQNVLDFLERMLVSQKSRGAIGFVIEILILQALIWQEIMDSAKAIETLGEVLSLAQDEKYKRVFIDGGTPMALLLSQAIEQNISASYARELLEAFPEQKTAGSQSKVWGLERLTHRELEVLHLLAGGATNQEIAQELVISVNTAKKHVSNLRLKLGANNRREAVRQGKKLGLIK